MSMFKMEDGGDHPENNKDHRINISYVTTFRNGKKVKEERISPEELYAPIITEDPVVNSVMRKFKQRSDAGMLKYGITLADNTAERLEWITHAQEEAMDFILYLERLKKSV